MRMNRGFTIAELVIVVVVLSILVGLAGVGASAMLKQSRAAEGKSEMTVIKAALEKYYAKNNEYPSAALLAGGGDGRNLSDAQYTTIATTLGVSKDVLKGGTYTFMPCAVGNNLCCTVNGSGECEFLATDTKFLVYMTRSPADVAAGNVTRTFRAFSSGCTYTFSAPNIPSENGYTAFYLMYLDPSDSDWWTAGRVHSSDKGKMTRGAWCRVNDYNT